MQAQQEKRSVLVHMFSWVATTAGRVLISLFVPAITFFILWRVFLFLRDSDAPQIIIILVAILWGVGGVAILFGL